MNFREGAAKVGVPLPESFTELNGRGSVKNKNRPKGRVAVGKKKKEKGDEPRRFS